MPSMRSVIVEHHTGGRAPDSRLVKVQQLESTNGFIVFDLDDAPSTGMVRLASKIVVDGAVIRARSVTYSLATFGQRRGGASAGINAKSANRDKALTAFLDEVGPLVADGRFTPWPGTGVSAEDLAPVQGSSAFAAEQDLVAGGAVAAADVAAGGLAGTRVVVVAPDALAAVVKAKVAEKGGDVVDGGVDTPADVVFVAGPPETVDHHGAAGIQARVLVPLSPAPVTARALAILSKAATVVVPDFVAIAAPLLAGDGSDPVEQVATSVRELADAGAGLWVAAAERAEAFLVTWQDTLPFGRPLS
jgi:hypothetical protein